LEEGHGPASSESLDAGESISFSSSGKTNQDDLQFLLSSCSSLSPGKASMCLAVGSLQICVLEILSMSEQSRCGIHTFHIQSPLPTENKTLAPKNVFLICHIIWRKKSSRKQLFFVHRITYINIDVFLFTNTIAIYNFKML
jgi:hypothetical protein